MEERRKSMLGMGKLIREWKTVSFGRIFAIKIPCEAGADKFPRLEGKTGPNIPNKGLDVEHNVYSPTTVHPVLYQQMHASAQGIDGPLGCLWCNLFVVSITRSVDVSLALRESSRFLQLNRDNLSFLNLHVAYSSVVISFRMESHVF
jgi:hypothetical protein